jgi:hydroxymethylglutaryl-CoA lyase
LAQPWSGLVVEDETLRDGLQNEQLRLATDDKLRVIRGLEACGVRRIQVGSFVHPKWVPQMADTDEVFARLERSPAVVYTALVLNMRGIERALACGVPHLSMSVSASETHNRKNTNRSLAEARAEIRPMIERALAEGITVRAGIMTAFGCAYEGSIDPAVVTDLAAMYSGLGVHEINLADTTGMANPRQVRDLVGHVQAVISREVGLSLHLHDTRGLGLANMVAGYESGVRVFDAALGGLGGCPFIPNAAGNIATEDAVHAFDAMGVDTGIDWAGLCELTLDLEARLGRPLPGRMAHLPRPDRGRARGQAPSDPAAAPVAALQA